MFTHNIMSRARDYCFTFYDVENLEKYKSSWNDDVTNGVIKYWIFGEEICPTTGRPHLQTYIYWKDARTFSAIKKQFPEVHIEPRGAQTVERAANYCRKGIQTKDEWKKFHELGPTYGVDAKIHEGGEMPNDKRGNINDWKNITKDIISGMSLQDLTLAYPEAAIRYASGIKNMYELHRPKHKFSILEKFGKFNDIQLEIMEYVNGPTHDREIYWIFDPKGGVGKTDLANHLISNNGFLVFGNGKTCDIALAWNGEDVIFDYSRSQQDHINYGVIEDIKNGRIFSGKYQSCTKLYKRPKVIVFANFLPDTEKMSEDRWNIKEVINGKLSAASTISNNEPVQI